MDCPPSITITMTLMVEDPVKEALMVVRFDSTKHKRG